MATSRPSRSASIPIPRSISATTPGRNIESLITMPVTSPAERPIARSSNSQTVPHRPQISVPAPRINSDGLPSPSRRIPRPTGRVAFRSISTFEPRVIRAGTEASSQPSRTTNDPLCVPHSTSIHRPSSEFSGLSHQLYHHTSSSSSSPSFPRPGYLEYSALRHVLQCELSPTEIPSRRVDLTSDTLVFGRNAVTSPSVDNDHMDTTPSDSQIGGPSGREVLRIPARWSEQARHPSLNISSEGHELVNQGGSFNGEKDAAAARTNCAIPPACGIYYYEVEIVNKDHKGQISIGFTAHDVKYSRFPGWEINSWGYQSDDGYSCAEDKITKSFGPTYTTGDVIGCGIDFTRNKVFYTKNATLIGSTFDGIGIDVELYPTVGLRHSTIRVNFGQEPFKYDIEYHVQQQRNVIWTEILGTNFDSKRLKVSHNKSDHSPADPLLQDQPKAILEDLVMTYLIHHGYRKTARAFQKQNSIKTEPAKAGSNSKVDNADMDTIPPEASPLEDDVDPRTKIVTSLNIGDVDQAILDTQKHYPDVFLAEDGMILFKLRCRKFIELILETAELKKRLQSSSKVAPQGGDGSIRDSWIDEDSMDVDEVSTSPPAGSHLSTTLIDRRSRDKSVSPSRNSSTSGEVPSAQYETALNKAISYGQTLTNEYRSDGRREVKQIFKQTFSIVAWEDPLGTESGAADIAGTAARIALANELNMAILKSQGKPISPPLETLYRHTTACVSQLGMLGVGSAAFADMPKDLLDA